MGQHKRAPLEQRIAEAKERALKSESIRIRNALLKVTEDQHKKEAEMLHTKQMLTSYFNYIGHMKQGSWDNESGKLVAS